MLDFALVVSRHPGAVDWLAAQLCGTVNQAGTAIAVPGLDGGDDIIIPVLTEVTPDDVRGLRVAGNLPLHLAALAEKVYAIEFTGEPPRGAEYSAYAMEAAGAHLTPYSVKAL